ncbi:two-component system histidine kinase PnpS [Thermincola ferriacetica]
MFKSLRWRFSLTYFAITALFLTLLGIYLINSMVNYSYAQIEERLISSAWLLSNDITLRLENSQSRNEIQKFIDEAKNIAAARVTLIDKNGTVIGDSHEDYRKMANHANRPEFIQALNETVGKSVRFSATLGEKELYVAVPVKRHGRVAGAVRLAIPWREVQAGVWHIRWIIGTAIFIVFVLTVTISSSLAREITAPLKEMTEVAKEMAEGKLDNYVRVVSDDEVGALGRGLNYMARRLKDTIKEITEEKNKIQAILTSMVEGVIAVDKDTRILLVNPAFEKIFNVVADQVIGLTVIEGIRNYELEKILLKALKKGRTINQEIEIVPLRRAFRVNVVPLMRKEKIVGVVAVFRDIAEIRELEKMRSEFVANVSHELRTPLTSIKGFVETLLDGAMEDREVARRFLEIINVETNRLSRLINDILSLSSIEAKNKEISRSPVNFNEIVEKVLPILVPMAEEKNITVETDIHPDLPVIMANEDLIKQVLINLVDNAIKYTPENGRVVLSATPSGGGLKVSVKDTGIGIPPESMSRLFERFYRVDKARSRELGGTGLGLAIVKHALEAHGGTIKVESQVGMGSKFTFYLPAI